jgi:hypothetical protein
VGAILTLRVRRKIAATAANLREHHQVGQRMSGGMCNARNQSAVMANDRPADMGASHAHVPADIVGKLIILGIVLAFSLAARRRRTRRRSAQEYPTRNKTRKTLL